MKHNSREFNAKNTDPERTHLNTEYCNEKIKDVYHELFDDALERYNQKQKRADRKIENYYEKIRSGKQEKTFHEIIIQVGNIEPQELSSELGSSLKKKLNSLVKNEDEFREKLSEDEKKLLQQYTNLYNEFLSMSIADSLISGFRLGTKFTLDAFVK